MTNCEADRHGFGRLAFAGVLVAIWLEVFQWVITRVFVLNFEIGGLNATALLVLLLITGWTVPVSAQWPTVSTPGRWFAIGIGGTSGSLVPDPILAAIAGSVGVIGVTTVLVVLLADLRARFAVGAGLGVALYASLRAWFDTAPIFATTIGRGILVVLLTAAIGCWLLLMAANDGRVRPSFDGPFPPLSPLGVFLIVQATYLGAFHSLSTWALRPYAITAGLGLLGLLVGTWLVERSNLRGAVQTARFERVWPRPFTSVDSADRFGVFGRSSAVVWSCLFIASLTALLWLDTWGMPFVFLAQVSAVVLLAIGSQPETRSSLGAGTELAVAQLVALQLAFLYVSAVNWAFMPSPVDGLTRGLTAEFLLALGALLPISVLIVVPSPARSVPAHARDRRTLLSMVGLGVLGLTGLGVPGRSVPADEREAPPIRVLTYNVHRYFSGGDAGEYNLEPLVALLREANAHVIGLQETEGTRITSGNVNGVRWLARRLGYHYAYGAPTRAGGYGVSLLSVWPIENTRVVQLPTHDSPPRWVLVADLRTPFGELPVAVTHFQLGKPGDKRAESTELLIDELGDVDRAVIMGDFNFRPTEPMYETMTSAFTDAWMAAGHGRDEGPTYSASDPQRRIDYIWFQGGWTVQEAERLGSPQVSDHLAVFAAATPD